MTINKNITSVNYNEGSISRIKYIVIHYTGNDGDTAYANTEYFKSVNRGASAHYFVDEKNIWQCVEDKDIAWHCGTSGKYYHNECRNSNSLSIELCSEKDSSGNYYFNEETVNRAALLTAHLMNLYGINSADVIRHYDVTHKNCPAPFVEDEEAWKKFKAKLVSEEDDEVIETIKININGKEHTINRILKNNKNYICLAELADMGFDVGYDSVTKIPSLCNTINDISVKVDGQRKSVKAININGSNFVKIRELTDILGGLEIDYKDKIVIINTK